MKRISGLAAVAAVVLSAACAQPLKQRIAAIVSCPEYLHARFGMEFWGTSTATALSMKI